MNVNEIQIMLEPVGLQPLEIPAGNLRRELAGQLAAFELFLDNDTRVEKDQMTVDIRNWLHDFKDAIGREENVKPKQTEYIGLLQKLLIDAIMHAPVDEDAYLGTDGETYGKKALQLYLKKSDMALPCHYSPNFWKNPFKISVAKHPIVPTFIKWLQEKGDFHPDEAVEQAFERLSAAGPLPRIPTAINEKRRCYQEDIEIKQLKQKLKGFERELAESPLLDKTTEFLRSWHRRFTLALDVADNFRETKEIFFEEIGDILQDPLTFTMLEDPYLGSDGNAYSKKSLQIYIWEIVEPFKTRSPMEPQNTAQFTVIPHPIAGKMIQWLKDIGRFKSFSDLDEIYQELTDQGKLPDLPTEENLYRAHLRRQEEEQNRLIDEELEALEEQYLRQFQQATDEALDPVRAQINAGGQVFRQRLGDRQQVEEQMYHLLMNAILYQEEQIVNFHDRIVRLDNEQAHLDERMDRLRIMHIQIQKECEATRAALKKREKGWAKAKSLLIVSGLLTGCVLGTIILQGLAAKGVAGMTMKATPYLKGGGMGALIGLGTKSQKSKK